MLPVPITVIFSISRAFAIATNIQWSNRAIIKVRRDKQRFSRNVMFNLPQRGRRCVCNFDMTPFFFKPQYRKAEMWANPPDPAFQASFGEHGDDETRYLEDISRL